MKRDIDKKLIAIQEFLRGGDSSGRFYRLHVNGAERKITPMVNDAGTTKIEFWIHKMLFKILIYKGEYDLIIDDWNVFSTLGYFSNCLLSEE